MWVLGRLLTYEVAVSLFRLNIVFFLLFFLNRCSCDHKFCATLRKPARRLCINAYRPVCGRFFFFHFVVIVIVLVLISVQN